MRTRRALLPLTLSRRNNFPSFLMHVSELGQASSTRGALPSARREAFAIGEDRPAPSIHERPHGSRPLAALPACHLPPLPPRTIAACVCRRRPGRNETVVRGSEEQASPSSLTMAAWLARGSLRGLASNAGHEVGLAVAGPRSNQRPATTPHFFLAIHALGRTRDDRRREFVRGRASCQLVQRDPCGEHGWWNSRPRRRGVSRRGNMISRHMPPSEIPGGAHG